jgi:peptidoglycan/LPS O-acetylase OafA/YrhL
MRAFGLRNRPGRLAWEIEWREIKPQLSRIEPPQRRLANLQVLRAIAALSVVHAHTGIRLGSWHGAGQFGVDIFFVLSGFIMAMISAPEGHAFFVKRLTRIVPPYWTFTLLAYAALAYFPVLDPACDRGAAPLLKSLCFVSYARPDGSLFPILGVGWTLNYEMCFYVLVALGLLISRKRAGWVAAFLLFILMLTAHLFKGGVFSSFYGNEIMLEFVMGILAFQIYSVSNPAICQRLRLVFLGACAGAFCFMYWYQGTRFYGPSGSRLYFIGGGYVLVQSAALLSRSGWEVRNRAMILIGDASYTLYLSHVFVLSVMQHLVSRRIAYLEMDRPLGSATAVLLSVGCAVLVYVYCERPMHQALNRMLLGSKDVRPIRVAPVEASRCA